MKPKPRAGMALPDGSRPAPRIARRSPGAELRAGASCCPPLLGEGCASWAPTACPEGTPRWHCHRMKPQLDEEGKQGVSLAAQKSPSPNHSEVPGVPPPFPTAGRPPILTCALRGIGFPTSSLACAWAGEAAAAPQRFAASARAAGAGRAQRCGAGPLGCHGQPPAPPGLAGRIPAAWGTPAWRAALMA